MRPLAAVLILCAMTAGHAHSQLLRGMVVDEATGRGVPGAAVTARAPGGDDVATILSDSAGFFFLRLPAPAAYTLHVARIGYTAVTVAAPAMAGDEEVTVRITLAAEAVPLQPVAVTGRRSFNPLLMDGYYRRAEARRSRNDGRLLMRQDLDRMVVSQASDYLRHVPSLQLRPAPMGEGRGQTPMLRRAGTLCEPAVYLNANRIAPHNIDSFVRPGTLEGIEVYTQGDEPPEFWDRTGCGVILLWNRSDTDGERLSWGRAFKLGALVAGAAALFALIY